MRLVPPAIAAAPLVFGSGLCALVYQIVWTRELRFVFGASTAAAAAVVAIFIAGLGAGGLWLGRIVERSPSPLRFYANLELGIALSSALTLLWLGLARSAYIALGGSLALGVGGATLVRLLLSLLVLGVPTFLMGGTLPAVARAIETAADGERRGVAIAYGMNTLGAVLGCLLADFVLLEALGARRSLLLACALNVLVALAAHALAARMPARSASVARPDTPAPPVATDLSPLLVLSSAAVVGFSFFLMELVWYRLFGPLLGGTVFAFGLILAVALFGIGVGSAVYTLLPPRVQATSFALTCVIEALLLAGPYALGDQLALWSLSLRPLGELGFAGLVLGWTIVCSVAVLPAALLSGFQFPLLIALLGRGDENVGRQVGQAYAANTIGAIAGALAGGFGLLPALGALGAYRLAAGLLLLWGALIAALAVWRQRRVRAPQLSVLGCVAASVLLLSAEGPTAAFRHSPIGAGRADPAEVDSPNRARAFLHRYRQAIVWQAEGVEAAVALEGTSGLAFVVNGKIDGNARADAATQVMLGLVGAALLPRVENALVVGLGTGSSGGWLGKLPGVSRVDVAEIEPAITEVAARCKSVNEDVLHNPRVHVFAGDARELLAVSRTAYDLIVSEPSNPYRAGIASLYTKEFYEHVARRLSAGGVFVQWLQSYEIDASTVRTIYATLGSVFTHVQTYRGMPHDLFLIASKAPLARDAAELRRRLASEPFARALRVAWRSDGLEGFLGHFVAGPGLGKTIAPRSEQALSTDDLSPIEFAFGRHLGRELTFSVGAMRKAARAGGDDRPALHGEVDWARVELEREAFVQTHGQQGDARSFGDDLSRARLELLALWSQGQLQQAYARYRALPEAARAAPLLVERLAWAESAVNAGDPGARALLDALAKEQPTEAAALRAAASLKQGRVGDAVTAFTEAFTRYRDDPWPQPEVMERALRNLQMLGSKRPELAAQLAALLARPFAVHVNDAKRRRVRLALAQALGPSHPLCLEVFAELEPSVPWEHAVLSQRALCYETHGTALTERAKAELARHGADARP